MLTAAIAPNEDALISPVVADAATAVANTDDVVVTVDAAGVVYIRGQQTPNLQIGTMLSDLAQAEPSPRLAIKADATLDASALIELLVLAREVGIDSVALMTIRR